MHVQCIDMKIQRAATNKRRNISVSTKTMPNNTGGTNSIVVFTQEQRQKDNKYDKLSESDIINQQSYKHNRHLSVNE